MTKLIWQVISDIKIATMRIKASLNDNTKTQNI